MNSLVPAHSRPLRALSMDEARKPLLVLFAAYEQPYADRNAEKAEAMMEMRVNAYILGLQGLPQWAVEEAVTAFLQGKVERSSGKIGKLPVVEELAKEARRIRDEEGARQAARQREQETYIEHKPSAQERARMMLNWPLLNLCNSDESFARFNLARNTGLPGLVQLAEEWGVPVPDEVREQLEHE